MMRVRPTHRKWINMIHCAHRVVLVRPSKIFVWGIGSSNDGSSGVFEVLFEGVSTFLVHNAETCSEHAFWKVGFGRPNPSIWGACVFDAFFLVIVIVISDSLTILPLPNLRLGSINSQTDDSMTMCMSNSQLRVTRWWSHDDLQLTRWWWSHDGLSVQLTTSSHKMMSAWRCVCPTHNFESQDDERMTMCMSNSTSSHKMMVAWLSVCPTQLRVTRCWSHDDLYVQLTTSSHKMMIAWRCLSNSQADDRMTMCL